MSLANDMPGQPTLLATLAASLRIAMAAGAADLMTKEARIDAEAALTTFDELADLASSQLVHATTIQSWEVREQSDDDFTDEQRRPWNVALSQAGHQLSLRIWPAGEFEHTADEGLGLMLEVNKGRPAVHIAPSPMADSTCHVHSLNGREIEVTPDDDRGTARGPSRLYAHAEALILSTGEPG